MILDLLNSVMGWWAKNKLKHFGLVSFLFLLHFNTKNMFQKKTFKDVCFCPTSYVNSHLSCFNGDSLSLLQQGKSSRNIEAWVSSKLGDGDVSFSKYFSLSGPGLPALRVHADAARPVYCFVKPKSVIVWFVGVEGKGDKGS